MDLLTGHPFWPIRAGLLHSYPSVVVVDARDADMGSSAASTWFALGYGGNGITFSMTASAIIREA